MSTALEHPVHEHALNRVQSSGPRRPNCDICTEQVHGTAYTCGQCDFFLHEPCALVEFPLQIAEHPMHPEHPLVFRRPYYMCDLCDIFFYKCVVLATLPPLEDAEDTMRHAGHEHTLYAFHVRVPNWISCNGCREGIPGPAYGCFKCEFFLHESCARLPEGMLHQPFHRDHLLNLGWKSEYSLPCKACHTRGSDKLLYSCEECDFELDFRCAALLLPLQDQENEAPLEVIDHFSHKHQLLSSHVEERKNTRVPCAVCELQISGEVYYCLGCIFLLHKQCAEELVQDMAHYLHTGHRLVLHQEPTYEGGNFECGCCGMTCSGMVFHCASCDFDLDPRCALQTFSAVRDGAAAKIQHFSHEDPLILRYVKEADESEAYCKACYMRGTGLVYRCDKCEYVLHKSCAEVASQLEHPLHPSHPLVLLPDKPHRCDNCSSESGGFSFYCTECVFRLCLQCAQAPTLKHQLHEHTLSFFERSPLVDDGAHCNYCAGNCIADIYRCTPCNFNLHRECLPLPPTTEHECHPYHPLVLFDGFVEGLPEYQYCDYCEEIRNPDRGVYRCAREECWYTVHIGCVLPQVRQHEDAYHDKLRNEITSLKETIGERKKDLDALEETLSRLEIEETKTATDRVSQTILIHSIGCAFVVLLRCLLRLPLSTVPCRGLPLRPPQPPPCARFALLSASRLSAGSSPPSRVRSRPPSSGPSSIVGSGIRRKLNLLEAPAF